MNEQSIIPLVSIIVPVYNAERYLRRCLDSLINQDYQNFEIILINDGSTDSSKKICEDYCINFPNNIRLFNQDNLGASVARKRGIHEARGNYLMFVDSDDFVAPTYITALLNALFETGTQISQCLVKRLEPGELIEPKRQEKQPAILSQTELFKRFFRYEFWGFVGGCFEKTLFENIKFPIATIYEDYYVKAQVFTQVREVALIDDELYFYEQHPGSLSHSELTLRALGEFDNAVATVDFLNTQDVKLKKGATSIVGEVICKWYPEVSRKREIYPRYYNKMREFLQGNFLGLMINRHLYWKQRVLLLKYWFCKS